MKPIHTTAAALSALIFWPISQALADGANDALSKQLPSLVDTYKSIHAHPELSHHEEQTAMRLAGELRKAGYDVTERVGRYPDGSQAYGVVAVLKNGPGRTLLIRADMDALPITEATGVPYASEVKGVMHACGHDVHTTALIGTARILAAARKQWHGTLMLIGQPSEETIDGARAMLADHLYERFGTPDFALALHDTNVQPAGVVEMVSGASQAAATSIDVTLRGIGGHGAAPEVAKDPIVMAGEFIVELQTVVSRQEDPSDPSVVTIGQIHGGTKRNIIPNEVTMNITARTFSDKARQIIVDGVRRTAQGVALAAGVPDDLAPIVTVVELESTPVMYNDPGVSAVVRKALEHALGAQNVLDAKPIMASEDFGVFGLDGRRIPTVMFYVGAMDRAKFDAAKAAGKALPGPHTSLFQPLPEPTLRTSVQAMSAAALAMLK